MTISAVTRFAKSLTGELVLPRDQKFVHLRRVRNHTINKRPAITVRCANRKDVRLAVEFAHEKTLLTAIQSGPQFRGARCMR